MMRHIAIVLAAGRGKRMNSAVAKQYLMIQDKPVTILSDDIQEMVDTVLLYLQK